MNIIEHYYVTHDADWLTSKVVVWLLGLKSVDLTSLMESAGAIIPDWLSFLLSKGYAIDESPVSFPGDAPRLPSFFEILEFLPKTLSSGGSLPKWGGYENAGYLINPGGSVVQQQNPYDCILSDIIYNGLAVFLQSGMFSGSASLVCSATAYYRRLLVSPTVYPGIDVNDYYPSGSDTGFVTVYPSTAENPTTYDAIDGMPVSQWYDFNPNPVISSYVPAWQFPPVDGGFPEWHFLAGVYDFYVSTHGLSSGLGYIKFNKPWPQYDPSFVPVGFNAHYPSEGWLSDMGMIRTYYSVSADIKRLIGRKSKTPPIIKQGEGTPRIHVRGGVGGRPIISPPVQPLVPSITGGGESGDGVPLIPFSTGGGEDSDDSNLIPFVTGGFGGVLSPSSGVSIRILNVGNFVTIDDDPLHYNGFFLRV